VVAVVVAEGHREMRDVVQEAMAGAHRVRQADGGVEVALDELYAVVRGADDAIGPGGAHHDLREAIVAADEPAVRVGEQQRHVAHVHVGEIDAEEVARLRLHHCPGGHAAELDVVRGAEGAVGAQVAVGDEPAGAYRLALRVELILAQEYLVRGVRAVGLVLVDERGSGVGVLVNVVCGAQHAVGAGLVGGARQHHEVGTAALDIERIVGHQGDHDGAAAAFRNEVEAVVEELAEERHPRVERRGEAEVGRLVRDEVDLRVVLGAEQAVEARADDELGTGGRFRGDDRRRVVGRLVGDQVGDGARLGIEHVAAGLLVGGLLRLPTEEPVRRHLRRAQVRARHSREQVVGSAELAVARRQVVEAAVDGSQAERHLRIRQQRAQRRAGGVLLCDENLIQDELQVCAIQLDHVYSPRGNVCQTDGRSYERADAIEGYRRPRLGELRNPPRGYTVFAAGPW
jgi:hypothetical protein